MSRVAKANEHPTGMTIEEMLTPRTARDMTPPPSIAPISTTMVAGTTSARRSKPRRVARASRSDAPRHTR